MPCGCLRSLVLTSRPAIQICAFSSPLHHVAHPHTCLLPSHLLLRSSTSPPTRSRPGRSPIPSATQRRPTHRLRRLVANRTALALPATSSARRGLSLEPQPCPAAAPCPARSALGTKTNQRSGSGTCMGLYRPHPSLWVGFVTYPALWWLGRSWHTFMSRPAPTRRCRLF